MNHFPHVSRKELIFLLLSFVLIEGLIRYYTLFYVVLPIRNLDPNLNLEPITFNSFLIYNASLNFIGDVIKISGISMVISIGALIFNYPLRWNDSFRIVLISSFFLVGIEVLKLVYFSLIPISEISQMSSIESQFSLLAIGELLPLGEDKFLSHFLGEVSASQIIFILILSYGVESYVLNISFIKSLKFVSLTYGLVYFLVITFTSLMASIF